MSHDATRPYTLVAELTYRCPLRCGYCSNPVDLDAHARELEGADWERVLGQAEALGVMAVNFTGGEPLLHRDLPRLVARARGHGLYTNLITSGTPLSRARLDELVAAGLDHVQLSFQDAEPEASDRVAGARVFETKLEVAGWVKSAGLPLTVNVVLHADNVARVAAIIALAERVGASRLELAHTQYLGWALENRARLLPSRAAIEASRVVAKAARARLRGAMEVLMVLPDYVAGRPRACMDGWGRRFVVVSPDGLVLPCHAAHSLPGLVFDSVKEKSLEEAWTGAAMGRYRGEAWMPEPCKTCDQRSVDFGGCRCQAFALTGDATNTDPACSLAPAHRLVTQANEGASGDEPRPEMVMRERRRLPLTAR